MLCLSRSKIRSKIAEMYQQGKSAPEIRDELGVPKTTIYRWLSELGIKRRTKHEVRFGSKNPLWKGDKASFGAGRCRAQRRFACGAKLERHHVDGNPLNNAPENVLFVTRREHMFLDGRLQRMTCLRSPRVPVICPMCDRAFITFIKKNGTQHRLFCSTVCVNKFHKGHVQTKKRYPDGRFIPKSVSSSFKLME